MSRDARLDNMKGILIALVVLGHVLQEIPANNAWRWEGPRWWTLLYSVIYMVHMPAFAFLSGYLTSTRKSLLNHAQELLSLYLICQVLWCAFVYVLSLTAGSPPPSRGLLLFTLPGTGLWYLLSLFFWRASTPLLSACRYPVAALIALIGFGALLGLNPEIGTEMTLSRMLGFAPFFAAGFWCRRDQWSLDQRKISKWDIPFFAASGVAALFIVHQAMNRTTDLLTLQHPYYHAMIQLRGVAFRLALYLAAFGAIRGVFLLAPVKQGIWTKLGVASLSIYIGHFYLIELGHHFLPPSFWVTHMAWLAPVLTLVCCFLFTRWSLGDSLGRLSNWLFALLFSSATKVPPTGAVSPAPQSRLQSQ